MVGMGPGHGGLRDKEGVRDDSELMTKRWLILLLSYGLAGLCLYLVFHGISLQELLLSLAGIRWWWVALAILLDLLVYACAGWEWKLLLRPVGRISFPRALQAVLASRFANDVLTIHAGYVVRIFLTIRAVRTEVAPVISSLLIERIFDVFWLVLGIGLTTVFFPLPAELARAGDILGGGLLAGVALTTWLILRPRRETGPTSRAGVFQLVCAAWLRFFGVSKPVASGFALLSYVVLTAPLTLAGFVAAAHSGLTLAQIRHEVRAWAHRR